MDPFSTITLDLSMRNPDTGKILQAKLYTVDGIDRPMSIGQLVMAICLNQATTVEARIVEIMQKMTNTSVTLDLLTMLETKLLECVKENKDASTLFSEIGITDTSLYPLRSDGTPYTDWAVWLEDAFEITCPRSAIGGDGPICKVDDLEDIMSGMESAMDELNSFSQTSMIDLQSLTNKRDQAYDMVSNIEKSLYSVMTGLVNNM